MFMTNRETERRDWIKDVDKNKISGVINDDI